MGQAPWLGIFTLVGIGFLVYIAVVGIHELGHIMIQSSGGSDINEISLMGMRKTGNGNFWLAWTESDNWVGNEKHKCWDDLWSLDFKCFGEKLW